MKDNFTLLYCISIAGAVAFFLPLIALLWKKMVRHPFFAWFAYYWAFSGVVNLILSYGNTDNVENPARIIGVINSVDVFLILAILSITMTIAIAKSWVSILFLAFFVTSISLLVIDIDTHVPYVIGIGTILVVLISIIAIIHYYMKRDNSERDSMQILIYYAMLFEFGISVITFVYTYVIPQESILTDNFLIYYLSIILSTTLGAAAILFSSRTNNKSILPETQTAEQEVEIGFL